MQIKIAKIHCRGVPEYCCGRAQQPTQASLLSAAAAEASAQSQRARSSKERLLQVADIPLLTLGRRLLAASDMLHVTDA